MKMGTFTLGIYPDGDFKIGTCVAPGAAPAEAPAADPAEAPAADPAEAPAAAPAEGEAEAEGEADDLAMSLRVGASLLVAAASIY